MNRPTIAWLAAKLRDSALDGRAHMSEAATGTAIQLTDVRKTYGSTHAVDGIELRVEAGEIVAILGPNGAGKTTTIDMILGLTRPDSGRVSVFGMPPAQAAARGLVAAVLQAGGLLKDLSVAEAVRLIGTLFADSRPVDEVLDRAGIESIAGRMVGKCSGGEQQRLRFAMALPSDPELMALDEPTTGMDVAGRRDFWAAIRQDTQRGRTILFATHNLEEADAYADRIVLLRQGRIVADGTATGFSSKRPSRTPSPGSCSPPPRPTTSRSPLTTSRRRSSSSPGEMRAGPMRTSP